MEEVIKYFESLEERIATLEAELASLEAEMDELKNRPEPEPQVVEKVVEKIVEVEPPARTELVVPDVVEPVDNAPPAKSPGAIFGGMDRRKLAALESAARRELAIGRELGFAAGIFGRKK